MSADLEKLWTYQDLAARWRVSVRAARAAAADMGLRPLKLGGRTARFRPQQVMDAEMRATGELARKPAALWRP